MNKSPKVTVLMPVYNVALYVAEAIESILNQTYSDFELLIINDGSTDSTSEEVFKFSDSRIRFVENDQNIGLANTLNRGIDLARGEYIARMDGDDISLPERLRKQVAILDTHPDIDICGAGYRFFGAKNYDVIYPQYHEEIKAGLLFGCCMIIPLFRRESIIDAKLRYEQNFFPAEDYRFWTCCVLQLKMYNIQETLFHYRMHPTQVSEIMTNQPQMTVHVKEMYFKSLFPQSNDQVIENYVHNFIETSIHSQKEINALDNFVSILLQINNEQKAVEFVAFEKTLHNFVRITLKNYVLDTFFGNEYTFKEYLKLLFSGIYLRLPFKFRIKLLIKSLLKKKN